MKIALFGGSFDPIHYGHMTLAESARNKFKLDKIIFIPVGKQPHKLNSNCTQGIDRFNMVKLAVKNNPGFNVSDYEIKSNKINYTYRTIEYFLKKFGNDKLFFLVGIDILLQLHSWEKGLKILELCPFLVGLRPKFPVNTIPKQIRNKVFLFKSPLIDISSTFVRNQIEQKKSISYIVPEKVKQYIKLHNLYS